MARANSQRRFANEHAANQVARNCRCMIDERLCLKAFDLSLLQAQNVLKRTKKLDEALSNATQLDHYFFSLTRLTRIALRSACKSAMDD